jgi:hypothetical protein
MTTETTVQPTTPAAETPPPPSFTVPEEYKARGWVEKIKTPDDLWKTLDNAQSLLGKKPVGLPAADAPDEEWNKYYNIARPESADKYTFSDVEGLPEGANLDEAKKMAQQLMFDAGLPQKQADQLWKAYIKSETEAVKRNEQTLNQKFDEQLKAQFGDKATVAQSIAEDMIVKHVPENVRASLQKAANNPDALVGIIAMANSMHDEINKIRKEYGAEGKLPDGTKSVNNISIGDLHKEAAALRMSPEARDPFNPKYKETINKLREFDKKLGLAN